MLRRLPKRHEYEPLLSFDLPVVKRWGQLLSVELVVSCHHGRQLQNLNRKSELGAVRLLALSAG